MSSRRLPRLRLTYANVASSLALFIALGGTSYAVATLPKNSVGTTQLRPKAVTAEKLADGVALSGPRGPRGAQGPQGAQGAIGAQGIPGSIAAPEPWQGLVLLNGWLIYDQVYAPAEFRKDGAGHVELHGLIKRSSATQSVIGQLPAGYRPSHRETFLVFADPDPAGSARIDVTASGEVLYWTGTSNGAAVSLTGISFAPGT